MAHQQQQQWGAPPPGPPPPQGPPMPPGWMAQFDANSQRYYYVEQATGRSQWEMPAAPPPPPQQNFGPPPGPPPPGGPGGHGGHGGPQPQQGGYPQGGYPPQGQQQYQQYPPQQGQYYQQQPQQQQYGQPQQFQQQPQQQPAPPSVGYDKKRQPPKIDTAPIIEGFRKAMKGMGTDDKKLIATAVSIKDPYALPAIKQDYNKRFMKDLFKDIESETTGDYEEALLALLRGPLEQDVLMLDKSLTGAGTDEAMLNDILLSRTNTDIRILKEEYKRVHKRDLESDVRDDTSSNTARMYMMVLKGERNEETAPADPHQIGNDAAELQRATEGTKMGADELGVAHLLTHRSDGQLRAIAHEYERRYHRALLDVFKKEFSGDMKDAVVYILQRAVDPAGADADGLEQCMAGVGTKDTLLINRIVRMHWNPDRLAQAKAAYRKRHGKDLVATVKEETRGDYEDLLVALLGGK